MFDAWYELVDLQSLKPQSVDIPESGKVVQVTVAECLRCEQKIAVQLLHLDFLDEMC